MPPPKLVRSRPDGSNCKIGGSDRPTQVAAPAGTVLKHRWKTQMLPFGSISARINSPHRPPFMLLGSEGQPSTRRYGLGSWVCWLCTATPGVAIATAMATNVRPTRAACDMLCIGTPIHLCCPEEHILYPPAPLRRVF